LIAAMIGLRTSQGAIACAGFSHGRSGGTPWYSAAAVRSKVSPPRARSAPAQKARPAPVTMIARTASSASQAANASESSRPMVGV